MSASAVNQSSSPREAPASALMNFVDDASHKSDRPGDEPLLCIDNIQGNSIAGFNKDFQTLVFLRISDPAAFKAWLANEVPFVSTAAEVLSFNRLFKALRFRRGAEKRSIKATWFNIGVSAAGLRLLMDPSEVDAFLDAPFKAALFAQSASLNDPSDAASDGAPQNWLFGGNADSDAHVVLICASDDQSDLDAEIDRIQAAIEGTTDTRQAATAHRSGATILYIQRGATLPQPLTGHEHFGWLDGVSQPGIRGKLSANNDDLLTPRQNPNEPGQGKPGQDCLYPGEFVFGYLKQDAGAADPAAPTGTFSKARGSAGADWTDDGSFYVVRRLRQDVAGFHRWLSDTAAQHDLSAEELGSALVGRHPHGAPVLAATADDRVIGNDDCRNNFFEFQNPPASGQAPKDDSQCNPGPAAAADPQGQRCPFSAHIRKAYPRDDKSTLIAQLTESDTQTHRLLRRGIPFGDPIADEGNLSKDTGDRGLLFAAYQTSIANQFEFVTKNWVNNPNFKEAGVGQDPILGQNAQDGRQRQFVTAFTDDDNNFHDPTLTIPADFVVPTGGGYFFTPSIDGLYHIAGRTDVPPVCLGGHVPPQPPQPPTPRYGG
ncbi:MAG TPA: Dyp-type peroxidase [Candidatus Rubrimentiphilum sp.]|nr:Dyp-type peroxidase [Candidatus Rubrimentiphilum sp.]